MHNDDEDECRASDKRLQLLLGELENDHYEAYEKWNEDYGFKYHALKSCSTGKCVERELAKLAFHCGYENPICKNKLSRAAMDTFNKIGDRSLRLSMTNYLLLERAISKHLAKCKRLHIS